MRKLNRFVSLALVVIMMMSMLVLPAQATEPYVGSQDGTISVVVRDSVTGAPLDGAQMKLEDITAGRYKTYDVKTTQSGGKVSWTGLSSGWYRVTQVNPPDNYKLNTNQDSFWFDVDDAANTNHTITREVSNVAESALYIYRFDPNASTGFKPLAGAVYEVLDSHNDVVYTGSTGADGYYRIPHVPNGEYAIREIQPPDGYNKSTVVRHVKITAGNEPVVVDFCDSELSTLTIINRDSTSGAPIAGSKWKVTESDTKNVIANSLTTDSNGMAHVVGINPGTYIVEETAVADGYISELKHDQFTIDSQTRNVVITLYNTKYGSIQVYVADSVEGGPLAGALFTLYDSDNRVVQGPVSADTNGNVTFNQVPDGNYHVVATAPDGYVMDVPSTNVTVHGGSNEIINVTATQKGTLTISSIDASTPSKYLPGTTFKITKMNGDFVGNATTGADGTVNITNLDNGYYIVEETAVPSGYVMVSMTRTVQVTAGKITTVNFYNRAKPFIVVETLVKGTETPIPGSTVTLVDSTGKEVRRGSTDANGSITFEDLEPGTYTAKFSYAPDGYTIEVAQQQVVVTTSKAGMATLTASKHSAIIIAKMDSKDKSALPGAIFEIRDSKGAPVDRVTTDTAGAAATKTLTPGVYTVRELFAPDGYVVDTSMRTVTVENNKSVELAFTNTKQSSIVVYAYEQNGTGLSNVTYMIENATTGKEVAQVSTNDSGVATTDALEPGLYTVTEAAIPGGYEVVNPTQSHIVLSAGKASIVRFVHIPESTILMQTVDVATGAAIPGAVYQITSTDGSFVANYTADDNGEAVSGLLEPGKYYVKQIVAPDGYLLNTTTQTMTVTKDQTNLAKFFNKQMSRIVIQSTIQGSDIGLDGCSFTVEDSTGKQVFHATTDGSGILTTGDLTPGRYTVKQIATKDGYSVVQASRTVDVTLNNATTVKFENTAHTSIIIHLTDKADPTKGLSGVTFQVRTIDGKFVTEVVTDAAGKAITGTLAPGTYEVNQFTPADGYTMTTTYQWANVTTGQNTLVEFTNNKISGLVIQSLIESDHSALPGTVFEVYHENGKLVGTYTADATGTIDVGKLDPDVYLIKEISVPDGHTARTTTQKVTITANDPTTAIFYHTEKSALTVNLVDAATKAPLAGATYRVTRADGTEVGTYTTNNGGQFVVDILPAGKYTIQQVTTIEGYLIDSLPKTVTIADDQNEVLNLTNTALTTLTIRSLKDADKSPLAGSVFELYDAQGKLVKTLSVDANGTVNSGVLNPGTYTVKEVTVPAGWTASTLSQTVTVSTKAEATLTFLHTSKSSLIVTLRDAKTNEVLSGGSFKVTTEKGDVIAESVTTDINGQFTLTTLAAGKYIVSQTNAPAGYVKDSNSKIVVVKDDQTASLTVLNDKMTGLTIESLDNKNQPLDGAAFELRDSENNVVDTYTVINGKVVVPSLAPGKYTVNETTTPDGWTAKTLSQNVTITVSGDATLKFLHSQKSALVITLKDAKTGAPLSGATFKITTSDGKAIATEVTNTSGQITLPSLDAGKYVVVETVAPAGYEIDSVSKTVVVKDNETATLDVVNAKLTGLTIEALDGNGQPLDGAAFELRDSNNNVVDTYTAVNGVVVIPALAPGKYTVNETTVPSGWTAVTLSQNVTITVSGDATLKFLHTQKSSLTVTLKDAKTGAVLADGFFKVTKENGDVVANSISTDSNGQFTLTSLDAGKYVVTEITAPSGYVIDGNAKTVVVKDNQTAYVNVLNNKMTGLTIETLSDTNGPIGFAQYEVKNANGVVVATVTADASGVVFIDTLAPGKYTVSEKVVPNGWTARTLSQNVTITSNGDSTLKFLHSQKSALIINLTDAKTGAPLSGGTFKISTTSGKAIAGNLRTDINGQIILPTLDAGKYFVTETVAPDGYVIDSSAKTVVVKDNETAVLDVVNNKLTGLNIEVLSDKNEYLNGAQFEVRNAQGIVVATKVSDASGIITIDTLAPGKYTVKETIVPDGWTARTLTQDVVIDAAGNQTLKFYHSQKSSLTVNLIDGDTKTVLPNAVYRIYGSNGDYVGEYTTNTAGQFVVDYLSAGTYTVEMIKAPDGYVIDNNPYYVTIKDNKTVVLDLELHAITGLRIVNTVKQTNAPIGGNTFKITKYDGTLVGNFTTNSAGLINVSLEPGTYTIYQTYVADGYVKNEEVWNITIKAGITSVLEVQNEQESRIVVRFKNASTDKPIYNVKVEIKDEYNNFIGTFTSDNNGIIALDDVLRAGRYKVSIIDVPSGYLKDSVPKTIVVKTGETTELIWKLTAQQGQITVVTYAGEDSTMMQVRAYTKLAGAVYQITDMSGNVVATITGDANGEAHSGALPLGTYFVQQISAPMGFQVNSTKVTVNVISTSDNKRIEVYNKAAYYNMTVSVHGQSTAVAGSTMKYYFTDIANNSSSAMSNFYLRIKVPTDAMRAITLYTGTYNFQTYYNIEYKTNQNDWRTLASGLNTKSSYNYDLSTRGLGLGIGEYVTDIRMVFPSVMAGFKVSMAPTLYTQVLSTVPSGYQAIMRAEVGGMNAATYNNVGGYYNGYNYNNAGTTGGWSTGASSFTTYIYGYTNYIPSTLPKTGY